ILKSSHPQILRFSHSQILTFMIAMKSPTLYGLMAEFDDPNALVAATRRRHEEGYRRMDAYSPFPIEELHEALGGHHTRLPLIVLLGGLVGCLGGFFLQFWVSQGAYPLNIGGEPPPRWAGFISGQFGGTRLGCPPPPLFC